MKSVKQQSLTARLAFSSIAFLFFFTLNLSAQGDAANGKKLFNTNCAACHKLDKDLVGPKLGGITDVREDAWLKAWIKDNAALQATDADAKEAAKYSPTAMTAFPFLTDENIDDILAYTSAPPPPPPVVTTGGGDVVVAEADNTLLYILIAIVFVLLLMVVNLYRTVSELRDDAPKRKTTGEQANAIWAAFKANKFLHFLLTIFFLLSTAYIVFSWFMQVGVDEGYQPIQPIEFSHKIHAGDNKIDCQYCHASAKHSKTSGIPSANVCMNCHMNISEVAEGTAIGNHGKEVLDKEIQKLYDAIGWDKDKLQYIEGYEKKPIEWVRVHNLPDFAYFNHSQHVTVAGVKCQECHGPVEEMDEVYQHAPLTMGWCIDCHRDTEVDMTENGYYEKIHEQLAGKYGVEKVTEAQMGGMECGKCHY
ncbi:c-type cytochrome [Urechidicola vernalis]|uniref:Cytochrome c3 family protein n=1 Tax=Urechidicola vernalis TaxID=3075600 RepID=A0ABU2Y5A2_9FLAO|nr:c-type cytochrome [Urechidicola sp. P050]MDT0552960.1 cytochrome c3 family protein [Urechidicola sp. P050]